MIIKDGFIDSIKKTQPQLWLTLEKTAKDGLIFIDEENDAVTASNRLLWTYAGLHEALSAIINDWNSRSITEESEENYKNLIKNLEKV